MSSRSVGRNEELPPVVTLARRGRGRPKKQMNPSVDSCAEEKEKEKEKETPRKSNAWYPPGGGVIE